MIVTFQFNVQEQFWPEVKRLGIKEKAIYMQGGAPAAPPYWSRRVDQFEIGFTGSSETSDGSVEQSLCVGHLVPLT